MTNLLWLLLAALHLLFSLVSTVAGLTGDSKPRESIISTAIHLAALAAVVWLFMSQGEP